MWKGVVVGVIATLLVMVVIGFGIVFTGAYDVAATHPHTPFVRWAMHTARENAVEKELDQIAAPQLTKAMAEAGAREFAETCAGCHGAPGQEPLSFTRHMRPQPPDLKHVAEEHGPEYVFWSAENGFRMTGMPAFGPTHDDMMLWNMVAFVQRLPTMTPDQYRAMTAGGGQRQSSEPEQ